MSVIIPSFNAERWVAKALDSVLAQTWTRIEIIVVDDGSTDNSLSVLHGFERRGVRVITQSSKGAGAARNRGLAEASGDYIQYLDADDIIHKDKIAYQLAKLSGEGLRTIASGPWFRFEEESDIYNESIDAPDFRDFEPAYAFLIQAWQGMGTMPIHAWLTPRNVIDKSGGWNENLSLNDDGEYFSRIIKNADKITFCEGAWSYYRISGPESVSARRSEAALQSLFEASMLCEQTLLSCIDTTEAQRACAGLWQQFLFTAYPDVSELVRRAEARVEGMGGMYRKPGVSRPLRPVRDIFGWKLALRLQRAYLRSGLQKLMRRLNP